MRELEAAGYLERRRERTPTGQVRTRTYFYDVPGSDPDCDPDPDPRPDRPPRPPAPRRPGKRPAAAAPASGAGAVRDTVEAPVPAEEEAGPKAQAETASGAPGPLADTDPRAIAVLAGLRRVDPRLVLSEREAARLAPAVTRWLTAGLLPTHITDHLTTRLPDHLLVRPAGILAYRLKESPLTSAATGSTEPPSRPAVLTMRNCDGCDRGFRSSGHSRCRDCRSLDRLPATA
ncbi:hypothetical protein [Streptomyces phaeolivaceus]|uniref:hypothetical protein n=1 Tax=Streptomyces phaeolivaceus TaxID=2653200 RepID=UPI00299F8B31|nr:hypothetical protein [Streptomyces phaeolivaceus]